MHPQTSECQTGLKLGFKCAGFIMVILLLQRKWLSVQFRYGGLRHFIYSGHVKKMALTEEHELGAF